MAPRYLLDTNVLSDLVRGHEAVQSRLRITPPGELAVFSVTAMEIHYGLALQPARTRRIQPVIDSIFEAVTLLPFTLEDARAAGSVRAALRRRGRPIEPYDVLLAGCALARGLCLVTANTAELERVTGLLLDDWR